MSKARHGSLLALLAAVICLLGAAPAHAAEVPTCRGLRNPTPAPRSRMRSTIRIPRRRGPMTSRADPVPRTPIP